MSRYINAFFLKAKIDMASFNYESEDVHFGLAVAKRIADKISTADVTEIKHGHWIDKNTGAYFRTQSWCSVCGKHSGIGGIKSNRHKAYCPNCGARMDGGDEV